MLIGASHAMVQNREPTLASFEAVDPSINCTSANKRWLNSHFLCINAIVGQLRGFSFDTGLGGN